MRTLSWTGLSLTAALMLIGAYFTFTAVQGTYGLFQRIQIEAEADRLAAQLSGLRAETERMEVLTERLSDDFLDLDLLDERARSVLGYTRPQDIVLP
ncbi:MAG: FtsB family cell division protein [Roseicyclus sp.]